MVFVKLQDYFLVIFAIVRAHGTDSHADCQQGGVVSTHAHGGDARGNASVYLTPRLLCRPHDGEGVAVHLRPDYLGVVLLLDGRRDFKFANQFLDVHVFGIGDEKSVCMFLS